MINYVNALSFITETVAKVGYSNDVLRLTQWEMIYLILIIGYNYFSLALLIENIAGFKLTDPLVEYTKKLNDDVYDIFRNPLVKTKMNIRKIKHIDNDQLENEEQMYEKAFEMMSSNIANHLLMR